MVRKENLYLRKMAFGEVEDMVGAGGIAIRTGFGRIFGA